VLDGTNTDGRAEFLAAMTTLLLICNLAAVSTYSPGARANLLPGTGLTPETNYRATLKLGEKTRGYSTFTTNLDLSEMTASTSIPGVHVTFTEVL